MEKGQLEFYLAQVDAQNMRDFNFSESYIRSVSENTNRWAKSGLLRDIKDPFIGRNVARLFESQRLFNESSGHYFDSVSNTDRWKQVSIPLIRRVFGENFIGHHLISFQAMGKDQENINYFGLDGRMHSIYSETRVRILPYSYKNSEFSLNGIYEQVQKCSELLSDEFGREIIQDLAKNVSRAAVFDYENVEKLISLIEGMSSFIGSKCNQNANWIVTSPAMVDLLNDQIEFDESYQKNHKGLQRVGVLNEKWKIFEDSVANAGDILLGLKDDKNHLFSGYIYSPYLPIIPNFDLKNETDIHLLARYNKKMIDPSFYGLLRFKNLPQVPEIQEQTGGVLSDTK